MVPSQFTQSHSTHTALFFVTVKGILIEAIPLYLLLNRVLFFPIVAQHTRYY
jgi:hypothetical protein